MAHPVVIRVAKLSSMGAIAASGQHTWRERPTPNADPQRTPLNQDFREVHNAAQLQNAIVQRLALATEKAASGQPVLCLEYLVTAHQDAFKPRKDRGDGVDAAAYLADALKFIEAKHGKENVVAVNLQQDEQAPHLVVYVVPLVEQPSATRNRSVIVGTNPDGSKRREVRPFEVKGRTSLSAAHYVGSRELLRGLQTEFAVQVGHPHGLKRGVERSAAKHQTVREWYAHVDQPQQMPSVTPEELKPRRVPPEGLAERVGLWRREETPEAVAGRVNRQLAAQSAPLIAAASTGAMERREAKQATLTAELLGADLRDAQTRVKQLENAFVTGLTPEQRQDLAVTAAKQRQDNQVDAEKQRRGDALANLLRTTTGAVKTFAKHAVAAIKAKAGQWRLVEWSAVEGMAVREAKREGHSSVAAHTAVLDHSPGQVGVSPQMRARMMERATAEDKAAKIDQKIEPEPMLKPYRGPTRG